MEKEMPWIAVRREVGHASTFLIWDGWSRNKKLQTHHADAQYIERNRLDLAVPKRLFPIIVYGLHVVKDSAHLKKIITCYKNCSRKYESSRRM
jgi:hypothetical protein